MADVVGFAVLHLSLKTAKGFEKKNSKDSHFGDEGNLEFNAKLNVLVKRSPCQIVIVTSFANTS